MNNIPEKYNKLHKLSFQNEKLLKEAKQCACFYCGKRFRVLEIKDWIEDKNGLTAQCPYCQIDSVVPTIVDNKEVTDEDLKKMNKYWF